MADLRFDADTMRLRINSTKGRLNQGTSVRVWLVHEVGFGTHITASDPTHYVTIVGYGESTFHFIDPWPHGSAFKYAGGMYPPTDNKYSESSGTIPSTSRWESEASIIPPPSIRDSCCISKSAFV
jgi:hypothetical protein